MKLFFFSVLIMLSCVSGVHAATATTTPATPPAPIVLPSITVPNQVLKWLAPIEAWRIKEVAYFAALKQTSQIEAKKAGVQDVADLLIPDKSPTPGENTPAPAPADNHTAQYAKALWATTASTFFSRKALFYIGGILLVLFTIRFIIRLF